jgi:hypothetical protein
MKITLMGKLKKIKLAKRIVVSLCPYLVCDGVEDIISLFDNSKAVRFLEVLSTVRR